jgi:hypothetical protein
MATQPDDTKPTIVLVHGAWADASGFAAEIRALKDRGFRAIGLANLLAASLTTPGSRSMRTGLIDRSGGPCRDGAGEQPWKPPNGAPVSRR